VAHLPEPTDTRHLRVSNADRERLASQLQHASAEGRLDLDELDQRLKAAYAARTFGELEELTSDLPAVPEQADPHAGRLRPTSRWAVALLGGFTRKGAWVVPRRFLTIAVIGGGKIDLRHARFAGNEVKIRIFAFLGGVEIVVSPETHLSVNGVAILGGWDQPSEGAATPGGPRVTVTGLAIMGGVGVKRQRREAK
jgi:hypothetical protein